MERRVNKSVEAEVQEMKEIIYNLSMTTTPIVWFNGTKILGKLIPP
jgi:hypothetical protein